ncbi:hypothetical protein KUL72_31990 [Bradyrhizobium arachidis]|uniref:hypothetical protein n=1 Tax=Bradyrhizobium arachidis TaxID=858423 RepID=UPI0021639FCB|nr:hypothetical protein [Bradyrhizobium arachidis]UVO35878.1 hypothetical protein KUL72_31990 [Bradyrhizobium arachidis]
MDPFNRINPFDRDHAAAPQQQQAEFEPYLDEVPQLDTSTIAENPVFHDRYYPHLSEEGLRLAQALGLEHQSTDRPHPEHAVTRHEDAAAQHRAPQDALSGPEELTAQGHDQYPWQGPIREAILASSLNRPAPGGLAPDPEEAVRYFSWSGDAYPPAANEPAWVASSSGHEVAVGEDYTGQPTKRQRTLSLAEENATARQRTEPGNSAGRESIEDAGAPLLASSRFVPEEVYDQDLLWAMVDSARPSLSLEPTEGHHQALDPEAAVGPFNAQHGDQHASAAHERSNVPPSQDSRPTSFIVHNDRYTALFVPAAAMRRSTPLNPPGSTIRFGSRPENVPPPSLQPTNRTARALFGRSIEQAAPASSRAQRTYPAAREIYAASFSVPETFLHGTQPAPDTMLAKLGQWGLLPDEAQPTKQYDIHGERYTALFGPGGPNDLRLIHHPRM